MDSIGSKLYAGKRRRRPAKRNTIPTNGTVRTNPSKRHRDRLNAELDRLASLLPFDSDTVTKLDKLSILRLSVSYLRNKSYFQGARDKDLFQIGSSNIGARFLTSSSSTSPVLNSSLAVTDGNGQKTEDALLLEEEAQMYMQALNGFIIVIQSDGQIFYASPSVQEYLGFQDADIMHQNVFELIHKEDREDFQKQLLLCPPTTCSQDVTQRSIANASGSNDDQGVPPEVKEAESTLDRNFTSRLRCLLDESSGFLSLQFSGRLRMLHGQRTRGKDGIPIDVDPPEMALFALASPLQQPTIMEIYVRNMIFRTKHKLDFKTVNLDTKGSEVLGYTDSEFRSLPGYQYVHYEDIIYCSEMHSSLIRKGETGFIYFRLMSKMTKWVWVQAKGRVMYKNGKPDYLVSTHRPMSDEEGEQHLVNRRKPFRWPFAGKAELYECNPPYPPIPPVILRALQRGEIPSFGGGPPPGIPMGDMPPGMSGMPPGMGGGMPSGMPPGMPPGMGGMPPGMGDFPPSGMPPFGGSMPLGDDGPLPFGMNKESMFSPRPERVGTPSFEGATPRYQFKRSPGYTAPNYSCEGGESNANSGVGDVFEQKDWQRMNGNRSFLENGIKGHVSPQETLPSVDRESIRTEFSGNLSNGSMNMMSETQSWSCRLGSMNSLPSNQGVTLSPQMSQQKTQAYQQHISSPSQNHSPGHALDKSNMCSPRSTDSNDSGFNSVHMNGQMQNNGIGRSSSSRKVAVVSPCQVSPGMTLSQRVPDNRAPTLSTGSLDSGVDNLPFENGEDIPTFDEALSLSTFDLEQQGVIAENLLTSSDHEILNSWTSNNEQLYSAQNQEFHSMPNQIGPKVEMNTMQINPLPGPPNGGVNQDSCNVLRSLLSNPQTQVTCKQEIQSSSSPVTSITHPNTVEWRSPSSKASPTSKNSIHTQSGQATVMIPPLSKNTLMQGSISQQQSQLSVRSSRVSNPQQHPKRSQQSNQLTHPMKSGGHRQHPPVQPVSNAPNPYNSPGHLPVTSQDMPPIQSQSQQPEQQMIQAQRQQLHQQQQQQQLHQQQQQQQLHQQQQQQQLHQQQQHLLKSSRQQNQWHHPAKSDISSLHQQQSHQQQPQQHRQNQQQQLMQQQQSLQAHRQQNLMQQHPSISAAIYPHHQQQQEQLLQQQQQHLFQQQQLRQQHQQEQQLQRQEQQFDQQHQNLSFQTTNVPMMNGHMQTNQPHTTPSLSDMQMNRRGYSGNQMMMHNGGDSVEFNQDLSLSSSSLHPVTQPDLLTPDLTSELLSTIMPGMNGHQAGDKQGLFELPMKGMVMGSGGAVIQNGFQVALSHSTNV